MQDKKTLRKEFTALRKTLKSDERDKAIADKLLSDVHIQNADLILMFASFGSETDTWIVSQKLLSMGKTIAFPRSGDNGIMTFHIVESLSQLSEGRYGICEPDASLPQPDITDAAVCVVPGLAFTSDGGRLGYGGGYYDRFLAANINVYRLAVAYDGMIVDELPLSSHDLKVDSIVTEERMVLCNG